MINPRVCLPCRLFGFGSHIKENQAVNSLFMLLFVFCEVHLDLSTPHIQGNYPGNNPAGSGRSPHGFGAVKDHEGPQDITKGISNRTGNRAWVSCVLNPTSPISGFAWPGNLPLPPNEQMSTTRNSLQFLIPHRTCSHCHHPEESSSSPCRETPRSGTRFCS